MFCNLIVQALQCCIAGVTAITSSWTGECCIALRQLVAGKNLTFTVVDVLNSSTVFAVDAPLSTLGIAVYHVENGIYCNMFPVFCQA